MSHLNNTEVLSEVLLGEANQLVQKLSKEQLIWLGGYLSGAGLNALKIAADTPKEIANAEVGLNGSSKVQTLKVLVGSHSGNGKGIAKKIQALAKSNNQKVELINMSDYKARQLKSEDNILFIVSTHGEGEPPAEAEELFRFLGSKRAGDLSHLNYAIIALGDSSYKLFCQTGLDFHERLQTHGAKPVLEPYLLDVDFKEHIDRIINEIFQGMGSSHVDKAPRVNAEVLASKEIFRAELVEKVLLNGRGSNKETYHVELDIEGSGFSYQPGDSIEVYAVNDELLVTAIIKHLSFVGDELVNYKEQKVSVKDLLLHHKEITLVTMPVLTNLSAFVDEPDLNRLLDNRDELANFLEGSDLLDVLSEFAFNLSPQNLADTLRSLPPRAYSIASSQAEVGDEVHLTIGAVRYFKNSRQHQGVCSTFLIDRVAIGDKVAVKIKPNEGFRLPSDKKDILLIGAGTGIAPYRSFIQERVANNGTGRNWLFFGDQHFETDFLYQSEWLKYRSKNEITRMDVAFSRDQDEKIYVQHRLLEKADDIYQWLKDGATVYVCGDRKKMAKDVQKAFVEILVQQGGLSSEQAEKQLLKYRKTGRYQEDVY
ncbi:diflavin oxidoreductase [Carboxylicivirga marina]|uniref:Flavodoxin domain-containing protein n=1 Tax=Carboxylicivirga marina TaxID=2800988 RepID=A0ABS1HHQ0_9BACT|nr:flavodoxin domain-containing protein [Carboxylicivirga marina]MBK3517202.1 flavodoxin domain-containing protein [Carboxylicivirga marina]